MTISSRRQWKRPADSSATGISVTLDAAPQTIADAATAIVAYDLTEEGNPTTGITTTDNGDVPVGAGLVVTSTRDHWINCAAGIGGAGLGGGAILIVYRWDGATSTELAKGVVMSASIGTYGVAEAVKRVSCVIGDVIYALVQNASGASIFLSADHAMTFLQDE